MGAQPLTLGQRRALAVLVVLGGAAGGRQLRIWAKAAQKQQKQLCADVDQRPKGKPASKVAVDRVFVRRLAIIFRICVPSLWSREAALIGIQGCLLVSRTLLTDYISRLEGLCGRSLISLEFAKFGAAVTGFAAVGIPAACVNSGLKFMTKAIELAFQQRLDLYLHAQYTRNRAYYAASTLGGLTHADQRITEDVEKFCYATSELYSHTFKPLLDVILFTRSLSRVMGYQGQLGLYAYYLFVAWLLRTISPPLATMAAQEAGLSGAFRAAHQRLVAHAEEVAYNDPPSGGAEGMILNAHLRRLLRYSGLSAFQRFLQQIADGYCVKYFASVVALLVYAAPLYMMDPGKRPTTGQLTADYIRSMRLLQATSNGVGDLILTYKRVANLAGHTSRVAELLEQVRQLSSEDGEHRELFRRNVSNASLAEGGAGGSEAEDLLPPQRLTGDTIVFDRVSLDAPDGTPLVRGLSFEVSPGRSVMLMGPNGCGKSSLFRVLAGLWPLQSGSITSPMKGRLFYLSQRPYLVVGTLRDQLTYPRPPAAVWAAARPADKLQYMKAAREAGVDQDPSYSAGRDQDAALEACLAAVDLDYLVGRSSKGWDQVQPWSETLSGGEKQRLAMARLLFHRPDFAILDECTSAVSADGEVRLYEACMQAGITLLSIAHRPALKRFHQQVVHIDGSLTKTGKGWWVEEVEGGGA